MPIVKTAEEAKAALLADTLTQLQQAVKRRLGPCTSCSDRSESDVPEMVEKRPIWDSLAAPLPATKRRKDEGDALSLITGRVDGMPLNAGEVFERMLEGVRLKVERARWTRDLHEYVAEYLYSGECIEELIAAFKQSKGNALDVTTSKHRPSWAIVRTAQYADCV